MGPVGHLLRARLPGLRHHLRCGEPPARGSQGPTGRQRSQQPPNCETDPMSETNRDASVGSWGRPLRKRSRGAKSQSADSAAPVVGPVDGPLPGDGAATIIRAEPVAAPTYEVLGAPRPYVPRERRDPDETDFKL